MKKFLCIAVSAVCLLLLAACSKQAEENPDGIWDCSVFCAEASTSDSYIITYSDAEVISKNGTLSFQNRNDFDIVVHLLAAGKEEERFAVHAGGVTVHRQIEKNLQYTVGCHADVEENTEIKLVVYDGERADPFT